MSRKSRALTYPKPLGPPRLVVGDLYLYLNFITPTKLVHVCSISILPRTVSANYDQPYVLLQVVSLSPAFSAGQVSLGTLNRQLTRVCFMWSEILTAVNIHRSIPLFPWRWQQQVLAKHFFPCSKSCPCLHAWLSTLLPRHCYINLLLLLIKRRLSKTWVRPNSRGSTLYSGERLYPLLKASRLALGPTQHLMQ